MNVQYRAPRVFVQFVGETLVTVSPEHIVSVRTGKAMGSPAGLFDILLKTGASEHTSSYGRGTFTDYWLENIRPMTLCIIGMGTEEDTRRTLLLLSSPENVRRKPSEILNSLSPDQQALVRRTIVMVGLVQTVNLRSAMRDSGPERGLAISGKDFAQILMDDALRRIARSHKAGQEERRIVTVGKVPDTERDRMLQRASINQKEGYWKTLSQGGADQKILLPVAMQNILENAPSYSMQLANGVSLGEYFKTVDVSPALSGLYVRATLSLFTYNGPVWEALSQQAPPPLAETFVDTVGLENRLFVRRPPFFRLSTMRSMRNTMLEFLKHLSFNDERDITGVMTKISDHKAFESDEFQQGGARVLGSDAGPHLISEDEIIESQLSRSIGNAISQYQVIPWVLTRGDPSGIAGFQGATGSYLYDLSVALRFGSRLLSVSCPWDTQPEGQERKRLGIPANMSSFERALAATETVRLYYYLRDGVAFLEGSLSIRARPEIRIGDRVYLVNRDLLGYVESVNHSYQFGNPFLTQLTLSRVQPYAPNGRLLQLGTDTDEEGPGALALNVAIPTDVPSDPESSP